MNSITFNEERDVEASYGYCNEYQPHAVKRMFDYKTGMLYDMRWDEAGNLGQVSMGRPGEMFEAGRFLFWTEDNRMHAAVDDRYYSYYAYDHSGGSCASREQSQACLSYAEMEQRRRSQRRLKLTGDNKLLDVNADFMATYTILNEPTLYPSAYMVLTNKGYTKHYYAGTDLCASREQSQACLSYAETKQSVRSNRVAARLGGGGLNALHHAVGNNDTLQGKTDSLFDQSLEQVNGRILDENNLDCIMQNEFAKEEFGYWIEGIPCQMKAEVKCDHGLFKEMVHSMLDDINHGQEKDVYFYHSDHLGSASWITDFEGMAVQYLQYLPYGEPYVNQHPFGYSERFTFTGKERDEETGFGYFGARYMDHELMTMWLSVDPMSDKYPSISPYAYCAWNPVKLVDPDGREVYITGDAADKATKQLSSRGITVTRDNETGRLSYTLTGKKLSKEDKVLMEAINSKNVIVNVNATTSSTVEFEGESLGNSRYTGQFLGVSVTDCENRIATASQLVNPDVCARRDGEYKVPIGISMRHEVTEAFRAGEICLGEGASYGPCWRDWKGYKLNVPEDHVYFKAHNRATPQAIDAAPIIQERREEANFKMANIIFGMSRDQWNRLDPIFRPHLP